MENLDKIVRQLNKSHEYLNALGDNRVLKFFRLCEEKIPEEKVLYMLREIASSMKSREIIRLIDSYLEHKKGL